MKLDAFWSSERWHAYERACGDEPGTRAAMLANATWATRVIDLQMEESTLWRGIAKTMRQSIVKGERSLEIRTDPPNDLFDDYQVLHKTVAPGRRPESYEQQNYILSSGMALLICGFKDGKCIGACYVSRYQGHVYYWSGPSTERTVLPALLWRAMRECKRSGDRIFEIGWQGHATTEKERQIEWFKSRFGGRDVSVHEVWSDETDNGLLR